MCGCSCQKQMGRFPYAILLEGMIKNSKRQKNNDLLVFVLVFSLSTANEYINQMQMVIVHLLDVLPKNCSLS